MLTPEQIQNLKPGDPIVIHTTFRLAVEEGDIFFKAPASNSSSRENYISSDYVSLPTNSQSQFDPTKPLIEGDIVKRRTVYGRTDLNVPEGVELTAITEEGEYGNVGVREPNGRSIVTKAVFLELITPVEELEPYSVHEESMHNRWNVIKDKYVHGVHAMFPYKNIGNSDLMSREEAKARADEYSARLNAEWRKEHAHD